MIKRKPRLKTGLSIKGLGFSRVIRVRLELTANGLKEHWLSKLNLVIARHTGALPEST